MNRAAPRDCGETLRAQIPSLAEPYAFALVTWPAVVGLFAPLPEAWGTWAQVGMGLWLAAMHLAAYAGGRGAGYGNAILFNSGIVALACWAHPSPWMVAWLPPLLIGLHASQRARLSATAEAVPAAKREAVEPRVPVAEEE